jgi:hypothetical protein
MANSETPFLISGEKTVAAAGTAEALVSASQRVKSVKIIAKSGNLGQVFVGGSDVASTTNDGLAAGKELTIAPTYWFDLTDIFIDVGTSGEGVDLYATKN